MNSITACLAESLVGKLRLEYISFFSPFSGCAVYC